MTASSKFPDRILVAIGGNATHPEDIEGVVKATRDTLHAFAPDLPEKSTENLTLRQLGQLFNWVSNWQQNVTESDTGNVVPLGRSN